MILADSSIWMDHLRQADPDLLTLGKEDKLLCHPFVIGEIALGSLRNRQFFISQLEHMTCPPTASHKDVMQLIENMRLWNRGVGYVDAHLVASTLLWPSVRLWTRDKKLKAVAEALGISASFK